MLLRRYKASNVTHQQQETLPVVDDRSKTISTPEKKKAGEVNGNRRGRSKKTT